MIHWPRRTYETRRVLSHVWVRESAILHALLGIDLHEALPGHRNRAAPWEGFALERVAFLADEPRGTASVTRVG